MSCSPAVVYSVCKPDISDTSKSEPVMLSLPLYLQSIHNKEFERNLHTAGSYLSLSECSLVVQPFLLALYLLWDNFLISNDQHIRELHG